MTTSSPEQTRHFGACLGRNAVCGSIIALSGELGSGKTCLTQGIAKGLDVPHTYTVTSPTFAIVNDYPARIKLHHIDLYRIMGASELEEIGLEEILAGDGVTVIEWADKFSEVLPSHRLDIAISVIDEQMREFRLTAHGQNVITWTEKCVE